MSSKAYKKISEEPSTLDFLGRLYFTIKDRYGVDVNIDDLATWLLQTPYTDSLEGCAHRYMSELNNPVPVDAIAGETGATGSVQANRFIRDHHNSFAGTAYRGFLAHGRGVLFVEVDSTTAHINRAIYTDPTRLHVDGDSPVSAEILAYLIELCTTYEPSEESIVFLEIDLGERNKEAHVGKLKLEPTTKEQIDAAT